MMLNNSFIYFSHLYWDITDIYDWYNFVSLRCNVVILYMCIWQNDYQNKVS